MTVIGLGLMGRALAETFLRQGHPTTVWNRTAAKAGDLVAQGARLAGSAREAVTASPLVVICVSDYTAVRDLLDPLGEAVSGRVLVNLTSGTAQDARDSADLVARLGGSYLDGAILAGPAEIGAADAVILYSGPQAAFDLHEPALSGLAGGTTHLGADHGLASLYDGAMLGLMWSILNGFLHGAALLGAAGVDAMTFVQIAKAGISTVADWVPAYAKQIDEGAYPVLDASIDTHAAAMEHLIHESEALGVSAELPRFAKALADRATAAGRGGDSYAALIEQFSKPVMARS